MAKRTSRKIDRPKAESDSTSAARSRRKTTPRTSGDASTKATREAARKSGGSTNRTTSKKAASKRSPRVVEIEAGRDDRPIEQRIAERAYEIWQARGGDERENWLEAERQVLGDMAS